MAVDSEPRAAGRWTARRPAAHAFAGRALPSDGLRGDPTHRRAYGHAAVVEAVLSRQLDDLEPRLTRHGYDVRSIADEFRIKPADVRLLLRGQLDPARIRELTE